MMTGLIAAIWIAWLFVISGTGYTGPRPGDRVDDRATGVSVRADLAMLLSLVGAVGAAVVVPSAALPGDTWLTVVLGLALVVLGLALRHWAASTLGRYFTRSVMTRAEHRVVIAGPYRLVRHPGYTGILVSEVGLGLTLDNWLGVLLLMAGFFLAHVPRIKAEEAVLEAHLGEQYREFERTRKRLIPGIW